MRLGQLAIDLTPLRDSRDFRYVFAARVVSLLGIGVTGVALAVQVYTMTGSSFHVSLVSLALGGPLLAGTLGGGVLADRIDRRLLIVGSRALAGAGFALLAVNAFTPSPALWAIYACAGLIGLADGISETALMAAVPALVGRGKLTAAEALTSITTQVGTIAGPSLGGLLLAGPGFGACYAITCATTLVTTLLLLLLRPLRPDGPAARSHPLRSIAEGVRFARRDRVIAGVILLDLSGTLFATPYALFPAFAAERLGGDPAALGLLYSAPAAGALLAALASGWTGRVRRPGVVLLAAIGLWGVAIAGFGASAWLPAMLAFLALSGVGQVISEVVAGAVIQSRTPDHLLGRVSSLWLTEATVGPALGNVVAGGLARVAGPGGAAVAGGLACVAGVAGLALAVPALRRARPITDPAATS
ncbi:enterobactin transporter EntS [Nonomuraea typhae]|uniref:enterobactin transporter EntS n=1 Tax=Nonomuraea typhae TaxID=2603600 RepID=UPI0012FC4345|nr:enterobactin transporter EntS [Nonomuraea typhae]